MNFNNRREFLKATGKVAGFGLFAGAFGSVVTSCEQDEIPPRPKPGNEVDVDIAKDHPELLSPGSHKVVTIHGINGNDPVIIKHNADGTFIVMDALCRHNNCNVNLPDSSDGIMTCLCHGATFSFVDGKSIDNKGFSTAVDLTNYVNVYDAAKKLLTITS
jgi:nitrite reductase/ring-hydroxylating ferredoxin subunit